MIFHARLGSMKDKAERIEKLTHVCYALRFQAPIENKRRAQDCSARLIS